MTNKKIKNSEEEASFADIIVIFIKKKWWFIGTFLIIFVLGFIYVFIQPVNHILIYQIEMKEDYKNNKLQELYPNFENDINFLSIENIPVLFKSEKVFRSVIELDESVNYQKLRNSDSVRINLNEETSIFNINATKSEYELADQIAKTLITSFEKIIEENEQNILNNIFDIIENDIEDLEQTNLVIQDTNIKGLEKEIDSLYAELDRFIVDYNIELSNRLEENKNSENVSFYNVIIPPNDISNEINALQKEINIYESEILDNKKMIISLSNLKEELLKDEAIIKERIRLISDSPIYKSETDRVRNAGIVIALSLIIGIIFTFLVNFIQSSSIRDRMIEK